MISDHAKIFSITKKSIKRNSTRKKQEFLEVVYNNHNVYLCQL